MLLFHLRKRSNVCIRIKVTEQQLYIKNIGNNTEIYKSHEITELPLQRKLKNILTLPGAH